MTTTLEPADKLGVTTPSPFGAGGAVVNGPQGEVPDLRTIEWRVVEDEVRRLRQRIFTASQAGFTACPRASEACLSRLLGNGHARF